MASDRRPGFTLPPGSCDTHVHIWGPFDRFPLAEGAPYTPPERTKHDLRALHRRLGIERAVIVQTTVYKADNRAMLDAIADDPARYRGVALVDETFGDAEYRALHEGGVRGVRFGFLKHLGGVPDLALLRRTADRIAEMGWHLVLHLDAESLLAFEELLRGLRVTVVVDHMGRVPAPQGTHHPAFRLLLDLLERPNWWVKVSGAERISAEGPPFRDAVPFARRLIEAAPDRTLWGTDWPHPNVRWEPDEADLVDLLPEFGDATALRRVLVDNPARLYGFP
ncbi:amidohydrolase family protein [Roseomonas alkaliterrae]|uniref:Putative TIM-barrel fold metal-dependent hydrolase n=1 Tax=Neoroseomonas alkaliterrae TaxID=1452450 RepID=A0A840XTA8_9PROT|nr:amidohydrolase family protein [Neoroseomonas alkaliterrae]MBB5689899.1 putative TIM-barrel fold metal-dependent hydrolase [Neoroseomonas alkaliterrae]MBR0675064.1 amidohydrolase family protein [Neoroseomonas alkaliterrae]